MPTPVLEQKCPKCGGTTHFDPKLQKLACDYCDTVFELDVNKLPTASLIDEFVFDDFAKGYEQPDAEKMPIYHCKSCGAELIAPAEQISMRCPYCRNNIVLTEKVTGNLRPNGILPFEIAADQLPALLREFYKDKKLLPKEFFSDAAMEGITGVYVPFWLFSGNVDGTASFVTSQSIVTMEGNYQVTTTSYYEVQNEVHAAFESIPVDASKRISDDMMDSLEPFDLSKGKPFQSEYLAGFLADRFDTPSQNLEARAKERIENTANRMLRAQVGAYDTIKCAGGDLRTTITAQYYLLPVYLFKLKYLNKKYAFAVNGQNGKIVGQLPNYKLFRRAYFLKRFGMIAGGIFGAFLVKYFLGG